MSIKNYSTTRNKELEYWQRMPLQASVPYDKFQMLKKLEALRAKKPKAAIWTNLIVWFMENRKLTYKQQVAIDTAYGKLQRTEKKNSLLVLPDNVNE